ncbi:MAG: S8 family serine peptidase [Phycisphaerales bacterium]
MTRNHVLCVYLCAGLAAPSLADEVVKPDAQLPYGSVAAPIRDDRPLLTDEMIVEAKRRGQDEILAQVIARGPAVERGNTPNFHYVRGNAVPMRLRGFEIGLLVTRQGTKDEVIAAAIAAARAAGLEVAPDGHRAVNSWAMLKLAQPAADAAAMNALIEKAIKSPDIRMASPVFENAFIEGGFYMPTDEALVRIREDQDPAAVAFATLPGFEVVNPNLGKMDRALAIRSTARNGFAVLGQINALVESGMYKWATPAALETMDLHALTPNDPLFNTQWAHRNTAQFVGAVSDQDMDTDLAWDITTGTSTVRVLIMDSGTQSTHPDLNWVNGRDFTTGAVAGVGTGDPGTCDDHGTAVAGCAAATMQNSVDTAGTAGSCSVLGAKIGDQATGPCSSSFAAYSSAWVVNALDWGRDNNARVSNASFGVGQNDAIEDMYTDTWVNSGVLHFASAGNGGADGIGDNGSGFPGSGPFTISVSALDFDGTLTSFSNYGTNCDLCSGGSSIRTTDRTGANGYAGGNFTYFSGTSAASPLAAGVGALFLSQHIHSTPSTARVTLFNSCVDLGAAGNDTFFSNGFINAYNALIENAPTGDDCASPRTVTLDANNNFLPTPFSTAWATGSRLEPDESCVGAVNNTVFFRFVAPSNGRIGINTEGSDYDTVLSVFTGCRPTVNGDPGTNPTQLACNDDGGTGLLSLIPSLDVDRGESYIIKVSKFGSLSGGGTLDFNLQFAPPPPPSNDTCQTATVINDPETGVFSFNPPILDTTSASDTGLCENDETCGSTNNGHSVFYSFTPAHNGRIQMTTNGSGYDTVMSVFAGCRFFNVVVGACSNVVQLACDDDGGDGLDSAIGPLNVTAGTTYIIKITSFGTGPGGYLDFNFQYGPDAVFNDECASATVIPGGNVPGGITNFNPAREDVFYATLGGACEPNPSCDGLSANSRSVWYTFSPQFSGRINVNTAGSNYDTVLTIHSRCPTNTTPFCLIAPEIGCSDNISANNLDSQILNYAVSSGTTYKFRVAAKDPIPAGQLLVDFNFQYQAVNCPADFNNDGNLDPDDLGDMINCFFSQPPCPGSDYNNDGNIDPDDLGDFINDYFAGC